MAETDTEQYHPSYNSQDGDLVLSSSDGVLFNVHSEVLRRASSFFKDMYDMPRSADETPGPLTAKADVIAAALDIIYPDRGYPKISSFEDLQHLQSFADYYTMPKVSSYIQTIINLGISSKLFRGNHLRLYVLCCRYGWEKEAKLASAETVWIDVTSNTCEDILEELSYKHHLRLMRLHQNRRRAVLDAIAFKSQYSLESEIVVNCSVRDRYGQTMSHGIPSTWPTLKLAIYEALERQPLEIVLRNRNFFDTPELQELRDTRCDRCKQIICPKEHLFECLQRLLDRIPKTV